MIQKKNEIQDLATRTNCQ